MQIKIIGIGPGSPDYILPIAIKELESSDVVIGFQRAIESVDYINVPKVIIHSLKDLLEYIQDSTDTTIAIIASGDPGYYGILDYIKNNIGIEGLKVIPGISSFQYLMAKLKKSWKDAYIGSLHGREADFDTVISNYEVSVWLTDKVNNPSSICGKILQAKGNYRVYVGENLSYDDERITMGHPATLEDMVYSDLSVVVVEKKVIKDEVY